MYSRFLFCLWAFSRHSVNGHKTSAGRKAKRFFALQCSSVQFSAVIFAVIFGYLFFDEIPDAFTFLGILIIVAASLGATIFRLKYYKEG